MKVSRPYSDELVLIAETVSEADLLKWIWVYGLKVESFNEFTNTKEKVSLSVTINKSREEK